MSLRYPMNKEGISQWIRISIHEREFDTYSDKFSDWNKLGNEANKIHSNAINNQNKYTQKQIDRLNSISNMKTEIRKSGSLIDMKTRSGVKIGPTIYMYMPNSITLNDEFSYEQVELSGMLSTTAGLTDATLATDISASKSVGSQAFYQAAQKVGFDDANVALLAGNAVKNPRAQMLFKNPGFRGLNLNFKFIPNDAKEAEEIRKIIKVLRESSYPELQNVTQFFKFPKVFNIDFLMDDGINKKMINFSTAICTNINITTNASSPSFHEDGSPSEIDMTITFQETEVMSSNKVKKGF